jgi:hypothetical protein
MVSTLRKRTLSTNQELMDILIKEAADGKMMTPTSAFLTIIKILIHNDMLNMVLRRQEDRRALQVATAANSSLKKPPMDLTHLSTTDLKMTTDHQAKEEKVSETKAIVRTSIMPPLEMNSEEPHLTTKRDKKASRVLTEVPLTIIALLETTTLEEAVVFQTMALKTQNLMYLLKVATMEEASEVTRVHSEEDSIMKIEVDSNIRPTESHLEEEVKTPEAGSTDPSPEISEQNLASTTEVVASTPEKDRMEEEEASVSLMKRSARIALAT